MKKEVILITLLIPCLSVKTYASAGYANDALEFILVLIGFLLFVAGLLHTIDFLRRNGRRMINRSVVMLKKSKNMLLDFLRRLRARHLENVSTNLKPSAG